MASRVFAVDLGAWSVKVVIATPGLRGTVLANVVERVVPPGDDAVEARAVRTLAMLIDELRLRDEAGYLGVDGDSVFTQIVEFGFKNLRRAELEKAVGGELESVVPVDLEDMVYAYEPIPAPPDKLVEPGEQVRGRVAPPVEGMRVLTYAMRKSRAEELIERAKQCGFDPRGIVPVGGAAAKLVERVPSLAQARVDGPVAIIDIGHVRSDVVVVHGGKAVFSRSIARAGKQVTEAIVNFWKLDFTKAEEAKHRDGFIASTAEPATTEAWTRIHNVLVKELDPFARDLRQTLAACRARTGFAPIAAVLVGGGSRLRGLGAFMTEKLGIPAWRLTADDATALAGMKLGPQVTNLPIESAALTIGMAYDCAGGRPQFDLRSGALALKVDLSFLRAKLVPLGAGALAILAFASIAAYADLYRLRKEQRVLDQRLATETQDFYGAPKTADDVLGGPGGGGGPGGVDSPMPRMTAYDVLLEINNHIPAKDKITLDVDKLMIDGSKIELSGTAKAPEEVDLLVGELKKIDCFHKDVSSGALETVGEAKKFQLTINSQCM
ncbi:MAG TPA: pilus assembly protein PilM [Kofleriaceae bacterium]|jgi:general secretion pathway protein L|nr:pilus assembly protein PilM [Kofleriaceae bacterium]